MKQYTQKLTALIIGLAISFGCVAKNFEANKVSMADLHFETQPTGVLIITGIGKNKSNATIKTNFVKFNLLQNGIIISSTIDTSTGIKPNQQWKIYAPVDTSKGKPDSFEVTDVLSN